MENFLACDKFVELVSNCCLSSGVVCMPVISSQIDEFKEERWPCCAVRADRGRPAFVRWWGLECVVLTSGCHVVISRRYHTRRAQMHIDPGTWVQPVNGVIFILLSSPLLSLPPPLSPPASFYFTSSPSLTPSSFLFLPLPSCPILSFLPRFCLSSVLLSHPLPLPSVHPHGSNSLSGLSHSLQASRQSLQRLEQKTISFKQHYIGLAWSMSHTDRWKHWAPQTLPLYDHDENRSRAVLLFSKPTALHLLQQLLGCKKDLSFVGIRRTFAFVSWSMQNKTVGFWEEDAFSLAAVLLDHLLWNHSRVNLV